MNPTQYSPRGMCSRMYDFVVFFVLLLDSWWLDLSKASDTVLHNILASALERHRFDEGNTEWIRYWLVATLKELQLMTLCPGGDQRLLAFLRDWYWDRHCLTSWPVTWTVGLSSLPANFPTTLPNYVVWLTRWREGMTPRKTLAGLTWSLPTQTRSRSMAMQVNNRLKLQSMRLLSQKKKSNHTTRSL